MVSGFDPIRVETPKFAVSIQSAKISKILTPVYGRKAKKREKKDKFSETKPYFCETRQKVGSGFDQVRA